MMNLRSRKTHTPLTRAQTHKKFSTSFNQTQKSKLSESDIEKLKLFLQRGDKILEIEKILRLYLVLPQKISKEQFPNIVYLLLYQHLEENEKNSSCCNFWLPTLQNWKNLCENSNIEEKNFKKKIEKFSKGKILSNFIEEITSQNYEKQDPETINTTEEEEKFQYMLHTAKIFENEAEELTYDEIRQMFIPKTQKYSSFAVETLSRLNPTIKKKILDSYKEKKSKGEIDKFEILAASKLKNNFRLSGLLSAFQVPQEFCLYEICFSSSK